MKVVPPEIGGEGVFGQGMKALSVEWDKCCRSSIKTAVGQRVKLIPQQLK